MWRGASAILITSALLAGCGWKPPEPPPLAHQVCTEADGPGAASVAAALTELPAVDGGWHETGRGTAGDCQLSWVQVGTGAASSAAPEQVLFFNHDTFLGTATPEPRPYLTVAASGSSAVTVQFQWKEGSEPDCCPTGIGSARFKIDKNGKLAAQDPIPGPS